MLVFDDMAAGMIRIKNSVQMATELYICCRKLFHLFATHNHIFLFQKCLIKLYKLLYLKQIALNHSPNIDYDDFMTKNVLMNFTPS